ncbi:hypothetical protein YN1_0340 [Nanoarchaeota archaeon]
MRSQRINPYLYYYYLYYYYYYLSKKKNNNNQTKVYNINGNQQVNNQNKNINNYLPKNIDKFINKNPQSPITVYNIYNNQNNQQNSSGSTLLAIILFIVIFFGGLFIIWYFFGNQISNTLNSDFGINLSNISISSIMSSVNTFWGELTTVYNIINNPNSYTENITNITS